MSYHSAFVSQLDGFSSASSIIGTELMNKQNDGQEDEDGQIVEQNHRSGQPRSSSDLPPPGFERGATLTTKNIGSESSPSVLSSIADSSSIAADYLITEQNIGSPIIGLTATSRKHYWPGSMPKSVASATSTDHYGSFFPPPQHFASADVFSTTPTKPMTMTTMMMMNASGDDVGGDMNSRSIPWMTRRSWSSDYGQPSQQQGNVGETVETTTRRYSTPAKVGGGLATPHMFSRSSPLSTTPEEAPDMLVQEMMQGLRHLDLMVPDLDDFDDIMQNSRPYDQSTALNQDGMMTPQSQLSDAAWPPLASPYSADHINKNLQFSIRVTQDVLDRLKGKTLMLDAQVKRCFIHLKESLQKREIRLLEKLRYAANAKAALLEKQIQLLETARHQVISSQTVSTGVANRVSAVNLNELVNQTQPYMRPLDNDLISYIPAELVQLNRLIDRFGEVKTDACAGLCGFRCLCSDRPTISASLQHMQESSEVHFWHAQDYYKIEVQTRDYLGAVMTSGGDKVECSVVTPDGRSFRANVVDCRDGKYILTTVFHNAGKHSISILINGKPIRGCPLNIMVTGSNMNEYQGLGTGRKFSVQHKPGTEALRLHAPQSLTTVKSSDGSTISEDSIFCRPWGVCCDNLGNIYVADRSNNHIKIFSKTGKIIAVLGSYGTAAGEFDRPSGVAFDTKLIRLIICDKDNHRIQVYSIEDILASFRKPVNQDLSDLLNPISVIPMVVFGHRGGRIGEFCYPWDCAVNSHSEILVTDTRNHRVQMFSAEGTFLKKYGYDGSMWKKFDSPRGIAVTKDDRAVVSDFNNHRIVILSKDFTREFFIGGEGEGPGRLKRPQGVEVDNRGNIIVADSRNYRIQILGMDGSFKYKFGRMGDGENDSMDRPTGICLSPDGKLLVIDFGNNRLLAF